MPKPIVRVHDYRRVLIPGREHRGRHVLTRVNPDDDCGEDPATDETIRWLGYDHLVRERPITGLQDLPAFRILHIFNGDEPQLLGAFNHLKSVQECRSWLYAGDEHSLIGDLFDLNKVTRQARFSAPFWTPDSPIQVGSIVPWVDGYWQAYHITMILNPHAPWVRTEFTPSPAQFFRQGDLQGWTKAGHKLHDDYVPTHIVEDGWDHEHCELCGTKIGRSGVSHGYVDSKERWICEECYREYAEPRSLGFVFSGV